MSTLPRQLVAELITACGGEADRVLVDRETLFVYECDGLTHFKIPPLAVAFPLSTGEVAACMKVCHAHDVPVTPRGAGTGLSGGALPAAAGGILLDTSRMTRILEVAPAQREAVVEPGVVNIDLSDHVRGLGLFYAPDPSSQTACTIGGNVAENAGGPHCLAYGATTNHVLGVTIVLDDGRVARLGGRFPDDDGPDLLGAFVGSEGTLGVITEIRVRLTPVPATVETLLGAFANLPDACRAVSGIVAAGIEPAALEALDDRTIAAVEASVFAAGYPEDAGAALLIELDGHPLDVAGDREEIESIFQRHGCLSFDAATDPAHRARLWRGRKGAFGAMGRVAPDLYVMDAVVPRSRLAQAVENITAICDELDLRIANVFHAGEGNLHPNISYDGRDADEVTRVVEAGRRIVQMCLDLGGALSGEHGIGVEKLEYMPLVFSEDDLAAFTRLRDAFNPSGLLNPGKILPTPRACTEVRGGGHVKADRIEFRG